MFGALRKAHILSMIDLEKLSHISVIAAAGAVLGLCGLEFLAARVDHPTIPSTTAMPGPSNVPTPSTVPVDLMMAAVETVDGIRLTAPRAAGAGTTQMTSDIVVLEFSDYQCPYCGRYERETYPKIQKQFIDTR